MELIYSSPNGKQIQQLQQMLHDHGIISRVIQKSLTKNEHKAVGYSFTELWITNGRESQRAKSIISRMENKKIKDAISATRLSWECDDADNLAWAQSGRSRHHNPEKTREPATLSKKVSKKPSKKKIAELGDSLALELIKKWFHPSHFTQKAFNTSYVRGTVNISLYKMPLPASRRYFGLMLDPLEPYWRRFTRKPHLTKNHNKSQVSAYRGLQRNYYC